MLKIIVVAVAGGASVSLLGAGVADASPSVWGKSYSEATAILHKAGYQVIIGSTVGDQLAQGDCLVTSQSDSIPSAYGPEQFQTMKAKTVTVALNCYPTPASDTQAGMSAANPNAKWLHDKNASGG